MLAKYNSKKTIIQKKKKGPSIPISEYFLHNVAWENNGSDSGKIISAMNQLECAGSYNFHMSNVQKKLPKYEEECSNCFWSQGANKI